MNTKKCGYRVCSSHLQPAFCKNCRPHEVYCALYFYSPFSLAMGQNKIAMHGICYITCQSLIVENQTFT